MTRNVIIGVLVVAVLVLGGFYLSKNMSTSTSDTAGTSTQTNVTPSSGANAPAPAPAASPKANVPTVITGTNPSVSSSTSVVTGQVRPNGALTTYWYEYGESTALGQRTSSQQLGSGFTLVSTPAFITGLRANTVYFFRLSAVNRFATVNGSTYNFKTNTNPPPTGIAPTVSSKNATDVSRTTATVNGSVNPNGWQTDFWFEYGQDTDLGNVTSLQSAGTGNSSASESITLTGLQPQAKYYFRINAQNQFGTVNGTILNFTTAGPANSAAPSVTTTAASNTTRTTARLNGSVNPNGEQTTYWFEYSQDSLLGTLLGSAAPIQTLPAGNGSVNVHQDITDLVRNTTYFYHLVGRNSIGTTQGSIMSFKTRD